MNFFSRFAARSTIPLALLAVVILAAAIFIASHYSLPLKTYTESTYRFSVMIPADFTATEGTEIDPAASTTVLLQNRAGDGVQILISPWDEPASALTSERFTTDTGLTVTDPQAIKISAATGLTFKSDNPAFDGAASEA